MNYFFFLLTFFLITIPAYCQKKELFSEVMLENPLSHKKMRSGNDSINAFTKIDLIAFRTVIESSKIGQIAKIPLSAGLDMEAIRVNLETNQTMTKVYRFKKNHMNLLISYFFDTQNKLEKISATLLNRKEDKRYLWTFDCLPTQKNVYWKIAESNKIFIED